jgi:hypothetical protein
MKDSQKAIDHNENVFVLSHRCLVLPVFLAAGGVALLRPFLSVSSMPWGDRFGYAIGAFVLLLGGITAFEYEKYVFDGNSRTVACKVYRLLRGRVPRVISFDDIKGLNIETVKDSKGGINRALILNCKHFNIKLVNAYSFGESACEAECLRIKEILFSEVKNGDTKDRGRHRK